MRLRAALALALASVLLAAASAEAADRPRPDNRIINGDEVNGGEYAWTVALVAAGDTDRAFCGGTLVQPDLVLTAAHCVIGTPKDDIRVVTDTNNLPVGGTVREIDRLSVHPLAEVDDDTVVARRDLALLTLDTAAAGSIAVGGGAQITSAQAAPDRVRVSGWGTTESSDDTVQMMRAATLDAVSDASCKTALDAFFGDLAFSPIDQICAIKDPTPGAEPNDDVKDTCQGDSGGPMVTPLTPGTEDVANPAHWRLIGVTSYGIGCATVVSNNAIPGVYARAAGAQLLPYASQATDTFPEQPEHVSGTPDIDTQGNTIFCVGNPLTWSGGVDQVDQLVRRFIPPFTFETVSHTGIYELDDGDFGDRFICEMHGRASGAGGYGLARSGFIQADPAPPPPDPVQIPGQTVTVTETVPGPTQTIQVDPRANDKTAPTTRSIRRSCTRRRVCTFTVATSDAAPSVGVTNVHALLMSVQQRGRRTTSRATVLRATPVSAGSFTFRIRTSRLAAGSHTLLVSAVDGAGNLQRATRRLSFRLR